MGTNEIKMETICHPPTLLATRTKVSNKEPEEAHRAAHLQSLRTNNQQKFIFARFYIVINKNYIN